MKKNIIIAFLLGTFLFSGFTLVNKMFSTTYAGGDYMGFTSIEEMAGYVDLVAVVKIKKEHPSFVRTEKEVVDLMLIETDADVVVENLVKGKIKENDEIILKQDGGEVKGKKQVWEGTTYVKEGKKYLVFLMELPNGKYTAVNPVQGILPISSKNTVIFSEKEYDVKDFIK